MQKPAGCGKAAAGHQGMYVGMEVQEFSVKPLGDGEDKLPVCNVSADILLDMHGG